MIFLFCAVSSSVASYADVPIENCAFRVRASCQNTSFNVFVSFIAFLSEFLIFRFNNYFSLVCVCVCVLIIDRSYSNTEIIYMKFANEYCYESFAFTCVYGFDKRLI